MPKTIFAHALFKKDGTLLAWLGLDKLVETFTWLS